MKLLLATKNDGKIKEIIKILDSSITFKTYTDFECWPEVEETGKTFKENALIKAKAISEKFKLPVLADDSGLEVDVLGGEPGVYSSRYSGNDGNDQKNIEKLLNEMGDNSNRSARFQTAVVYYNAASGDNYVAKGTVEGKIAYEPRGDNGFGYDPVFIPDGYDVTMAQFSLIEKNALSHRGKAIRKMKEILGKNKLLS